jgi:ABC-type Fe3+-hydroxamate transport system substrate-binding protein
VGGTKDPDVAAIVELRPDLVVVNDEENRREDADALLAANVRLHVTHLHTVADVGPCLLELAAAVGGDAPEQARRIADALDERLAAPPTPTDRITSDAVGRRIGADSLPYGRSAFVPIWRRPWMTMNGDTYGSSVLHALSVANVFADEPDRYPTTTLEDAAARHPTLVLAPTEPYPFADRHLAELRQVAPDARVVDGQDLFWWGARTPAALGRLAQALAS